MPVRDLRYQSSWVLLVNGAAQSTPAVAGGGQRPGQHAGGDLRGPGADPRPQPAGLGELGGPDHVHADQVDGAVPGGQPAHDQLTLRVGVARQRLQADPVAAGRGVGAALGGLPVGPGGLLARRTSAGSRRASPPPQPASSGRDHGGQRRPAARARTLGMAQLHPSASADQWWSSLPCRFAPVKRGQPRVGTELRPGWRRAPARATWARHHSWPAGGRVRIGSWYAYRLRRAPGSDASCAVV